jgi:hypothetical protein
MARCPGVAMNSKPWNSCLQPGHLPKAMGNRPRPTTLDGLVAGLRCGRQVTRDRDLWSHVYGIPLSEPKSCPPQVFETLPPREESHLVTSGSETPGISAANHSGPEDEHPHPLCRYLSEWQSQRGQPSPDREPSTPISTTFIRFAPSGTGDRRRFSIGVGGYPALQPRGSPLESR